MAYSCGYILLVLARFNYRMRYFFISYLDIWEIVMEKKIIELTKELSRVCEGKNAAIVVGAALNIIQTCMSYGSPQFQRACAESLRGMANTQLQVIGKPKH